MIDDRPDLLTAIHDDIGHWDFRATYKILADRYWWPSMSNYVATHVRTCDECQNTKQYARYKSAQHQPVSGIFDTWSLDFAGPLPRTARGNRYLLVGVEHLTGWPVAARITRRAQHGRREVRSRQHRRPVWPPAQYPVRQRQAIHCGVYAGVRREEPHHLRFIARYSPASNGRAERMVRTLKTALQKGRWVRRQYLGPGPRHRALRIPTATGAKRAIPF